jgi:hypothetical protein
MAKRRTRKDKETAKHQYTISWNPATINNTTEANVNRQNSGKFHASLKNNNSTKNAEYLAQESYLARTKRDIFKSLMLVILIIGIELVLYFAWKAK